MQKFKETVDSRFIYQNKLGKVCFQHDMAYGDFKDLPRRTAFDKVLHEKVFNIAKNPKHNRYQRGLPSMVFNFFDKKSPGNRNMSNQRISRRITQKDYYKTSKRKITLIFYR